MELAFAATVCLLLAVNVIVSVAVLRSAVYEPRQKSLQLVLVWFLPVVGAVLAWSVLRGTDVSAATPGPANPNESPIGLGDSVNLDVRTDAADIGGFGGAGH